MGSTGTAVNSYLYTGQQFDALTGLYDLRARYYDPALGRFLSQDTYPFDLGSPAELNRYVYTADDPINLLDPSGHLVAENMAIEVSVTTEVGLVLLEEGTVSLYLVPAGGAGLFGGLPIAIRLILVAVLLGPEVCMAFCSPEIINGLWSPRSHSDWQALARKLKIDVDRLTNNVESCKGAAGVPPNGNVSVDDSSGDIYYKGEYIGNARDGC